jgi:hypothetical protein
MYLDATFGARVHWGVALGVLSALLFVWTAKARDVEPPFPGTRHPQEILANLAYAIKAGGFGNRRATVAQMAENPKIRRLMEVEDQLDQGDYWLLELENASGQYIGMAAVRKDGRMRGIGAGDGVTDPSPDIRVADLAKVQIAIGARYGATRARYAIGLATVDTYQEYYPLIVADSPRGTIVVTRRLEVYRAAQRVPKAQRTDATRHGLAVPNVGKHAYVTKSGDLLLLESLDGLSREAVRPER